MRTPPPSDTEKDKPAPDGVTGLEKERTPGKKQDKRKEDIVDEAIEESFPASDPPSTSVPGTKIPPARP